MLTKVNGTGPQKQINVDASFLNGGAVVYTVPAGKTFKGVLTQSSGTPSRPLINGVAVGISGGTATQTVVIPLELLSGTVVTNAASNNNYFLSGIEE